MADSLTRSSASLVAAGGTLEEAVALTAVANAVIQNPESVGTALKTTSLRLRNTDVKVLEEEGLDSESVVTSKSKLRGKVKALSGVDILTDTGAYKSTYEILLEISKVWKDINDLDQAALLEIISGKRNSSVVAALLQNPEDIEAAYKSAYEAEGSALKENEKYLNSIQGRVDQFNNAMQTLWNNTLDDGLIKMFVDLATNILKVINDVGGLQTAFIGLAVFLNKKYFKFDNTWLGVLFDKKYKTTDQIKGKLDKFKKEYEKATEEFNADSSSKMKKDMMEQSKRKYETYQEAMSPAIEASDLQNQKAQLEDDLQTLQSMSKEDIVTELNIDTSDIDTKIKDTKDKLGTLRQEFKDIPKDRQYYIDNGYANAPSREKNRRINEKDLEIKETIKQLDDLKKQRESLIGNATDEEIGKLEKQIDDLDNQIKTLSGDIGETGKKGSGAWASLGQGVKYLAKEIGKVLAQMLLMMMITKLIEIAGKALDPLIETPEEATEAYNKLNDELKTTKDELSGLSSQLDEINNKIKEMGSYDSLSFANREELELLKAQRDELQRQIDLKEQLASQQQKGVNEGTSKQVKQYKKTATKEGQTYGKIAGGIIGGGTALAVTIAGGAKIGTAIGTAIAPGIGTALGAALGVVVGTVAGAIGGATLGGKVRTENVGNLMDNMQSEYARLEQEYKDAQDKYYGETDSKKREKLKKKLDKTSEAFTDYQSEMSEYLTQMDEYYKSVDLSIYDPIEDAETIKNLRQEMNDFYDTQDKWAIQTGGESAKTNAITRIFGENASDELKGIKKEILDTLETTDDINLKEFFTDAQWQELTARLYEMGIYAYEVEQYFEDMATAEKEASEVDFSGVVSEINAVSEGLDSLKSAFAEATEQGFVTASTLVKLKDTFGTLGDAWDNYLTVMASGISSTKEMQQATEDLVKAYLDEKIANGQFSKEERVSYIVQLKSMGVENAEEYIDDKLEENMYKEIQLTADYDETELQNKFDNLTKDDKDALSIPANISFEDLSDDQKNKIAEYATDTIDALSLKINSENAKEIIDEYGIQVENLDAIVEKLEERAQLEQQYQELVDAENKASDNDNKIAQLQEAINYLDELQSKYGGSWGNTPMSSWKSTEEAYILASKTNPNIDKEQFTKEYEALKTMFGNLEVDFNIDGITRDDIQKKLTELQGLKAQLDVEVDPEKKKQLQSEIDGINDYIEKELTADVKLKLEVQDKSQLVDDIQSTFDTLASAQKEYNENGYLTVDTMQSLLELEPKYLALLYDENGNLNLNKDTLYKVAIARITDMKLKQQDAILSEAERLASTGTTDALLQQIDATYDMANANEVLVKSRLANIRASLEERKALKDGEAGKLDASFDTDAYIAGLQKQLDATERTAKIAIDNIQNTLSSSGNTDKSDTESALEKLQKKYDRQIASLDHQKESLQNEIDLLEAQDQGVSKQYYEKQIELEQQKLGLYAQEREDLVALLSQTAKGSNEWYEIRDAIYEVENATQEATLAMVEMRNAIKDLYKEAFDKIDQARGDLDDLYSDRESYIEKYAELMDLEGEPKTAGMYVTLMNQESQKLANSLAEVSDLQYALNQYLANGGKKGDENWVAMESSIRDAEAAILDSKVALAQYKEELKQLKVEAFELVRNAFSNKNDYYSAQQDYINEYISYLEAQGIDAPEEIYKKLIEIEQDKRANAIENLADARRGLAKIEAAGYTAADEEWIDANNTVVELEKSILECDTAVAEWNKTIQEMDFSKFDEFADRVDSFNNELDNVYKLVSDEDVAFEDGTWTKEGLTSLAMLYQQIENNKKMIAEYNEELEKLNNLYQSGEISEKDYLERAEELKDNQWSLIHANEDLKDSIIDINEARIDLIEEGINKEIDAYQELIDLKKEELDAERDLYDFKKNIEKETKNIAELERKIAALSGSTSASDKAEKRKLEAQLRDAQDSLNDTYYNRSKDSQAKALDDEAEAYRKSGEDYVELLREKLENVDAMIEQTLSDVLFNADVTLNELNDISAEYGVTLSSNLMDPWQQMGAIATNTKNQIGTDLLSLNEDNIAPFSEYAGTLLVAPFQQGGWAVDTFKTSTIAQVDEIQTKVYEASSNLTRDLAYPWNNALTPLNTFSQTTERKLASAVDTAQRKAIDMENSLTQPWKQGSAAANTWSNDVENTLSKVVQDYKDAAAEISRQKAVIDDTPSYTTDKTIKTTTTNQTKTDQTKTTQKWAGSATGYLKAANGKTYVKSYQTDRQYSDKNSASNAAKNQVIAKIKEAFISDMVSEGRGRSASESTWNIQSKNIKWNAVSAFYKKGTLGTKKDELAVTDESWIGEEITLAANKSGQLQYLKKGSAVMPADISANLVEWGQLDPNKINFSNPNTGVNIVSNAVSKPELNFAFDSLVHVDHCDEGTLGDLEKMVDTKINDFSKKLNYAIKRYQ